MWLVAATMLSLFVTLFPIKENVMIFTKLPAVATIVIAVVSSFNVLAADESLSKGTPQATTPKTRAEVKAETANAAKEGTLNQHPDKAASTIPKNTGKGKSRDTVKKETTDATKAAGGTLPTPKP